jgi:hypothetical protein
MRAQCSGEDLRVGTSWKDNSDGDGDLRPQFFRGEARPALQRAVVLYWNQGLVTIWGHMTLLNLQHLVEPIFTGSCAATHPWDVPTNADIADHTDQVDSSTTPTRDRPPTRITDPIQPRKAPVDVAGKVDSIDVTRLSHGPTCRCGTACSTAGSASRRRGPTAS